MSGNELDVIMQSDAARGEEPKRLAGTLAPAEVIGNSEDPEERIFVQGADSISIRCQVTTVTSDPLLALHPIGPTGARAVIGAPTPVALSADTEAIIEYTLKGERYVEVEVQCDSGDVCTITHVDVYVRP